MAIRMLFPSATPSTARTSPRLSTKNPKRVPGVQLRRVRNIEVRYEVALLIDQYADDWLQLGYVLV